MYIKSLEIKNSLDGTLLRPTIEFHKGVNFIVDSQNGTKHNKVGKTTLLRLIDVILGGKDKKALYKDNDTKTENQGLKQFIENNRVSATLQLVDDLDENKNSSRVTVELFEGGGRYLNEVKISQDKLRAELNLLLFNNASNIPSFRQTIGSFIRISMNGDNNAFLRVIDHGRTSDYRALYNFLFDISDPSDDKYYGKQKKELDSIRLAEKKFLEMNGTFSIAQLEQIIDGLSKEIERVKSQLDDIVSSKEFKKNRNKISLVRNEYEDLNNKLNNLKFQMERSEEAINEAEGQNKIDNNLAKDFFEEIRETIPTVAKTYDELVDFNNKLIENKINYFKLTKEKLKKQYDNLQIEKNKFIFNNSEFISVVEDNKVDEYYNLVSLLNKSENEKIKKEETLSILLKFDSKKSEIVNQLSTTNDENLGKVKKSYIDKMSAFNKFFTSVAFKINGERPQLVYEPNINSFPVSISELNQGTSTGTKKSLIASYDIAYQLFAVDENKTVPKFILHDVLETVEGNNLRALISLINKTKSQYIVAVLKEKLDSSNISIEEQDSMNVIELSEDIKLFEGNIKSRK